MRLDRKLRLDWRLLAQTQQFVYRRFPKGKDNLGYPVQLLLLNPYLDNQTVYLAKPSLRIFLFCPGHLFQLVPMAS